jgi:hypothetical protein
MIQLRMVAIPIPRVAAVIIGKRIPPELLGESGLEADTIGAVPGALHASL